MPRYLEFAVASNFSFLRGASHAEELMLQAAHIGLDGLGLCDRNSVAGVVRAHLIKREKELGAALSPGCASRLCRRYAGHSRLSARPRGLGTALPPAHARQPARGERRMHPLSRRFARPHRWARACRDGDVHMGASITSPVAQADITAGSLPAPIGAWRACPTCHRSRQDQSESGCITGLPFPGRRLQGQNSGWLKTREKQAQNRIICSRFCALPPPAACGLPPTCSIAAMTARGWHDVPRSRGKPACRSSPSTTCSIIIPTGGNCRTCSPASAST